MPKQPRQTSRGERTRTTTKNIWRRKKQKFKQDHSAEGAKYIKKIKNKINKWQENRVFIFSASILSVRHREWMVLVGMLKCWWFFSRLSLCPCVCVLFFCSVAGIARNLPCLGRLTSEWATLLHFADNPGALTSPSLLVPFVNFLFERERKRKKKKKGERKDKWELAEFFTFFSSSCASWALLGVFVFYFIFYIYFFDFFLSRRTEKRVVFCEGRTIRRWVLTQLSEKKGSRWVRERENAKTVKSNASRTAHKMNVSKLAR